ncbi:MAG TPA: hypothetical protein VGQ48_14210 [Gemmatimonadales bacterium]|jgi:hypothetical protein|nr:hypothetical protein [Gemmatimonadales bacterium]
MRERWNVVALATCLSIIPSFQLSAQDTTRAIDTSRIVLPADTMRPGVRPMGAFWRSFLIPGWGQAATGRQMTGAAFVAWEGVTAMMTIKAQQEANYFKSIHSTSLKLKRQEVQDWLVLWIFNHLFSGAEAYVSAHLRDFPPDLKVRAFPGGIGVSIPLHE